MHAQAWRIHLSAVDWLFKRSRRNFGASRIAYVAPSDGLRLACIMVGFPDVDYQGPATIRCNRRDGFPAGIESMREANAHAVPVCVYSRTGEGLVLIIWTGFSSLPKAGEGNFIYATHVLGTNAVQHLLNGCPYHVAVGSQICESHALLKVKLSSFPKLPDQGEAQGSCRTVCR